jgi:DNA mismatch repair protein PMS2
VCLNQYGAKGIDVRDNGCGIARSEFANVARKHYTSKLRVFSDLDEIASFGFRGEALAALANVARLCLTTKTVEDDNGTRLEFDTLGEILEQNVFPREVGTTIMISDVFRTLPVRQEEFSKNIKREYSKLLPIVQAYALICGGVKISLYNTTPAGKRQMIFSSSGRFDLKENAVLAFGAKDAKGLDVVKKTFEELGVEVDGMVTALNSGLGRRAKDRHFCFVNRRPVDLPQVSKIVTECFRFAPGNQNKFPTLVLNFTMAADQLDVNVTPDKRTIFLKNERRLLELMREFMEAHYRKAQDAIPIVQNAAASRGGVIPQKFAPLGGIPRFNSLPNASPVANAGSLSQKSKSSPAQQVFEAFGFQKQSSQQQLQLSLSGSINIIDVDEEEENEEMLILDNDEEDDPGKKSLKRNDTLRLSDNEEEEEGKGGKESPSNARPGAVSGGGSIFSNFAFGSSGGSGGLVLPPATKKSRVTKYLSSDDEESNNNNNYHVVEEEDLVAFRAPVKEEEEIEESFSSPAAVVAVKSEPIVLDLVDGEREKSEREESSSGDGVVVDFNFDEIESRLKRRKKASISPVSSQFADGVDAKEDELLATFQKDYFNQLEVIGQFNNGFIIARFGASDLFIIDQHASNEIYNFENLQKTTIIRPQKLLCPMVINFSPDEEMDVVTNLEIFEKNGFLIDFEEEAAPGKKVRLIGRPESKDVLFGEEDVRELLGLIREKGGVLVRPSRVRNMFASRACRMSVMIGDPLSQEKMKKIVKDLATLKAPW